MFSLKYIFLYQRQEVTISLNLTERMNCSCPETPRNKERQYGTAMRSIKHEILRVTGAQQFPRGFLDLLFRFVSRQNERRKRTLIEVGNINHNDIKKSIKQQRHCEGLTKSVAIYQNEKRL